MGRNLDRQSDAVLPVQFVFFGFAFLLTDARGIRKAGMVKRQGQGPFHRLIQRVIDDGQRPVPELRIDMQETIDVPSVGPAQMNEVRLKNVAVFFEPTDPFLHDGFGGVRVVETRAAVAGLDAGAEIVGQVRFVSIEMIV